MVDTLCVPWASLEHSGGGLCHGGSVRCVLVAAVHLEVHLRCTLDSEQLSSSRCIHQCLLAMCRQPEELWEVDQVCREDLRSSLEVMPARGAEWRCEELQAADTRGASTGKQLARGSSWHTQGIHHTPAMAVFCV